MLKLFKKKLLFLSLLILVSFTPFIQSCDNEPVDGAALADSDADGIPNHLDNCVSVANPDQTDTDNDGTGDACDDETGIDTDGDGIPDNIDNCIDDPNPDQADDDNDGIGNACDDIVNTDTDGDGIPDNIDNCIDNPNPDQADDDNDGIGNVCDDVVDAPLAECIDGMAGEFPCDEYDLLAMLSPGELGGVEGLDSWGWTDSTTNTEYALVSTNAGSAFVDISNPLQPIVIGTLATATVNSGWRDIKVYQDHAFIVSEASGHGMQVFDLTRLRDVTTPPETFTADAHYTGFGNAHNIVINETSGYAYAVGTNTFAGGPHFINIQNPTNPIAEGGFNGYSHDAQVVTYSGPDSDHSGREILLGSNENEVVIVDITDKANPITLSTISYSNVGYTHQGWFTEDMRYFILGDETDELGFGFNTRTLVFDFLDLDNPTLHTEYTGPTAAIDHNGYVNGNTYFLANYSAGVRILDITTIASGTMTEIGFFDTYPETDGATFRGAWNVYPYFASGNIIISDINRGLFIIRKSD